MGHSKAYEVMASSLTRHRALFGALAFLILGIALRKLMPKPYVWVFAFLAWAVACVFASLALRNDRAKSLLRVAVSLLLALFVVEGHLSTDSTEKPSLRSKATVTEIQKDRHDPSLFEYQSNFQGDDPILGFRPKPGKTRIASRVLHDGKIVYDVIYTSLESGWRLTPQFPDANTAVVFFGCSFTYGEGLNDEESIPYRVGQLLGGDYQTFNFAFHGYGAHHMLAQIENGYLDDIARQYKRIIAFFLTIDGHELRCSGHSLWDRNGPWYALENGTAVYKGKFADMPDPPAGDGIRFLRNCLIYRALRTPKKHNLDDLRQLHTGILAEAERQLRQKYGASLTAVLWPDAPFRNLLEQRHLAIINLAPSLPRYSKDMSKYTITHDGHPNAYGALKTAEAIEKYISEIQKN
jgi:hypothetical protein